MNKAERSQFMHDRPEQLKSALDVNIRTNYTQEPDCYIDMYLWAQIVSNIQLTSAYWLRQYILECLMDMAAPVTAYGMYFDPYAFFPPGNDGSVLEVVIHLAFADYPRSMDYYRANSVAEAIQRYTWLVTNNSKN